MNNEKGFTLLELMIAIIALIVVIGGGGTALYVGWHFLSKGW